MSDIPDFLREFEPPSSLSTSPRFGRSSDISILFASDSEPQDYVVGLLFASIFIIWCFFMFATVILVFMCCGKERVGFLSGSAFDYSNQQQQSLSTTKKKGCFGVPRQNWVRGWFIVSGSIFILFAFFLVTYGITNLQNTVEIAYQSSVDIGAITEEADSIINSGLADIRGTATSVRDTVTAELADDNFCPADPRFQNNQAAADIREQADEALDMLTQLDDFLGDQIDDISTAVEQVRKFADRLEDETEGIDLTDWEVLIILIPCTLIPCLLVAAAILAHFDVDVPRFLCVIKWFLLPVFILAVLFCAVVASIVIVAVTANSDFCIPLEGDDGYAGGTPDTSIYRILDALNYEEGDYVRRVANYYIEQCQNVSDPYSDLTGYLPELEQGQEVLGGLLDTFQTGGTILELSLYCERDFDVFEESLVQMQTILDTLVDSIRRTLNVVSCKRIVPIYHRAVYDGACKYSVNALVWVFASSLTMAIFGFVMLLLRSAYKPTIYGDNWLENPADDDIQSFDHQSWEQQRHKNGEVEEFSLY